MVIGCCKVIFREREVRPQFLNRRPVDAEARLAAIIVLVLVKALGAGGGTAVPVIQRALHSAILGIILRSTRRTITCTLPPSGSDQQVGGPARHIDMPTVLRRDRRVMRVGCVY